MKSPKMSRDVLFVPLYEKIPDINNYFFDSLQVSISIFCSTFLNFKNINGLTVMLITNQQYRKI